MFELRKRDKLYYIELVERVEFPSAVVFKLLNKLKHTKIGRSQTNNYLQKKLTVTLVVTLSS